MKMRLENKCCLEIMAEYPDNYFHLAHVDPPYGLKYSKNPARQKFQKKDWDSAAPNEDYFKELFRVSRNQIIWGGNYFPFLWQNPCKHFVFWYKGNPVENFADGEMAWTSFDFPAKCFDYRYYGNLEGNTSASKKIHPTQKPRSLYRWSFDNYAKKDFRILDTHLGSGNHAIEAFYFGVEEFVGCEIDKEYFSKVQKNIRENTLQTTLF